MPSKEKRYEMILKGGRQVSMSVITRKKIPGCMIVGKIVRLKSSMVKSFLVLLSSKYNPPKASRAPNTNKTTAGMSLLE
jgi:hypothetical protein